MRPSSFVFVAIVALWAAHLLPQWIRRRDALGASRGDDRHSSALRVLARRRRRRVPGPSSAPLLPSVPVVRAPAPGPASPLTSPLASPLTPPPTSPPVARGGATALSSRRTPSARSAAQRRRAVLTVLAAATVLSVAGALAGAVPAALATACVLLLTLDVVALRTVALAGHRRRVAQVARAHHLADSVARSERVARARRADEAAAAHAAARAALPSRVTPVHTLDADDAAPAVHAAVDDRTWVPVPVPPPTYTLKQVAHRPEPAPLEPALDPAGALAGSTAGPVADAVADDSEAADVDLDRVLERRRAVNG